MEKRILVFELNWLGDVLFSFPMLRALRKAFPDSYISCVVVPRYVDLLVNNPWINFVHALSDSNKISSIGEKIAFTRMIKKEKYDMCFMLKPSSTKAVMAALAGIPERIGFSGKKAPLTRIVDMPLHVHRADQLLSLAGAVGVVKADGTYEYFLGHEDQEKADSLLREIKAGVRRIVAVNPGGNWAPKRWPEDNWTGLVKKIISSFKDTEIMVTGSGKDKELAGNIVKAAGDRRCYSVAGKTGLNELAALFNRCDLVVSADSGPLHLASAVGTATIGLFGPTSPKITGPRGRGKNIVISKGVECDIPCYKENCDKDNECMKIITVDDVFGAAERVLR